MLWFEVLQSPMWPLGAAAEHLCFWSIASPPRALDWINKESGLRLARNLQFSSDIIVEVRESRCVERHGAPLVDLNGRRTRCEATTDAFSATQWIQQQWDVPLRTFEVWDPSVYARYCMCSANPMNQILCWFSLTSLSIQHGCCNDSMKFAYISISQLKNCEAHRSEEWLWFYMFMSSLQVLL
jgi:hypothetical protein